MSSTKPRRQFLFLRPTLEGGQYVISDNTSITPAPHWYVVLDIFLSPDYQPFCHFLGVVLSPLRPKPPETSPATGFSTPKTRFATFDWLLEV